jgi:hypothetical protein
LASDESVVGSSEVRRLEDWVRELERLLGRETIQNEILREALAHRWKKLDLAATVASEGRSRKCGSPKHAFSVPLAVDRARPLQPPQQAQPQDQAARPHRKADDEGLLPLIRRHADERPTYGYRRIAVTLL